MGDFGRCAGSVLESGWLVLADWSVVMAKEVPVGVRGEAEETVEFEHTLTASISVSPT
jgi:hypothetical protein